MISQAPGEGLGEWEKEEGSNSLGSVVCSETQDTQLRAALLENILASETVPGNHDNNSAAPFRISKGT